MSKKPFLILLSIHICSLLISLQITAISQWSQDPNINTPICTADSGQFYPQMMSDGWGGAFIVWNDQRGDNFDIYMQHINGAGVSQWSSNGVALCTAIGDQQWSNMTSDGNGGAIITWQDTRNGNVDIYAQHINRAGVVQWTSNGIPISNALNNQMYPTIVNDSSGGAIISWEDYRSNGIYPDIYAQRINNAGIVQWDSNGIALCLATSSQWRPIIITDGSGGAIVTWYDYRSGTNWDVFAQRVNNKGVTQWTYDGVLLCASTTDQYIEDITSDGQGGAIIIWWDWHYGIGSGIDIYAQRISNGGSILWASRGMPICTGTILQYQPVITSDGNGGAIITWRRNPENTSGYSDIYAQRINSAGVVQWTSNGIAVCAATNLQRHSSIISDGLGGAIITWEDRRNDPNNALSDIYAQNINSAGVVEWATDGFPISTAMNKQEWPVIVTDGMGGAIITWQDERSDTGDIYTQCVDHRGRLGIGTTTSTISVNSRWNIVSFPLTVNNYTKAILFPTATSDAFTYTSAYSPKDTLANGIGYWLKFASPESLRFLGAPITSETLDVNEGWNMIGSISSPIVVSSIVSEPPGMITGNFFGYANGYSTADTIHPGKGYWVKVNQAGTLILSSSMTMSAVNRIRIVPTHELPPSPPEGEVQNSKPETPTEFALEQNYPNPFNPSTVISYQLKVKSDVTLKIYDVLGQEVATLVNQTQDAGYKSVEWNASNIQSGIYFYRLHAGNFIETKKLLLIK
ncbi:MAG: T9SS type A sorting domain-containing protein [Ignavibacteriae bacterium]|nr:T9SS type A sorting domain-containing protein [Ignavibacteriota bacterium]